MRQVGDCKTPSGSNGDIDHVLWMNATSLNESSLDAIRQKLGLQYEIEEVLGKTNVAAVVDRTGWA